MEKRVHELMTEKLLGKEIWDYKIWAPLSLEDGAMVELVVTFGKEKVEYKQSFFFDMVLRKQDGPRKKLPREVYPKPIE